MACQQPTREPETADDERRGEVILTVCGVLMEVHYHMKGGLPARRHGHPDDWEPAEPPTVEIDQILYLDAEHEGLYGLLTNPTTLDEIEAACSRAWEMGR